MPDWLPIDDDTPRDRPVLILAPAMDGLPDLVALTTWHPDAGFCVCPLRRATHWAEYRRPDDQAMRDHEEHARRLEEEDCRRGALYRQARKDKAMIDALSPRAREILDMREERPRQERDWWDR